VSAVQDERALGSLTEALFFFVIFDAARFVDAGRTASEAQVKVALLVPLLLATLSARFRVLLGPLARVVLVAELSSEEVFCRVLDSTLACKEKRISTHKIYIIIWSNIPRSWWRGNKRLRTGAGWKGAAVMSRRFAFLATYSLLADGKGEDNRGAVAAVTGAIGGDTDGSEGLGGKGGLGNPGTTFSLLYAIWVKKKKNSRRKRRMRRREWNMKMYIYEILLKFLGGWLCPRK
jgi:hypothetical protein